MQFHKAILPTVIAGASIALSSLPSRAAVITYTDRNSFLAALSSSSTDNYNDLATGYVSSPLNRSIPGYDYNAVGLILLSSDYGSKILWNGVNGDFLGVKEPLGNEPQKSTQSCNLLEMNNHSAFEAGLA
jgi:hypothetical protein